MDRPSERKRPQSIMAERISVLLVEDSRFDQKLIGKAILDLHTDLDLHTATTISEARRKLDDAGPEGLTIAFLDRHLPDGDGLDLVPPLTAGGTPMVVFCDPTERLFETDANLPPLCIAFGKEATTSDSAMADVLTSLVQLCSNNPGDAPRTLLHPHLIQIASLLDLPGLCNGIGVPDSATERGAHRSPA